MGCVTSKKDINDINNHIFEVENVDKLLNVSGSGQLKINDIEVVYYPRGSPPVHWPIKSLRRYGHDGEIFSFEAGRRCSTGTGIFAFRCQRAERLFSLVHAYAFGREDREAGTPLLQVEPNYLEPRTNSVQMRNESTRPPPRRLSLHNSSRLSSVGSSNGCTSPSTPNFINDDAFMHPLSEEPEGVANSKSAEHPNYENVTISTESPTYTNIDIARGSVDLSSWSGQDLTCSQRISVDLARMSADMLTPGDPVQDDSPQHCYANLDLGDISRALETPLPFISYARQMNYAVLDLNNPQTNYPPVSPTDSYGKSLPRVGYVTIDFDRTVALSQSASSSLVEGVRKTRHDSSALNDLITPTSSRHSACLSD